jgi:hypothetical protein
MKNWICFCALGLLASFFMSWIAVPDAPISITGFDLARAGAKTLDIKVVWLWLIPGLALAAFLLASVRFLGRIAALSAGAYPWGRLGYTYLELTKDKKNPITEEMAKSAWEAIRQFVGVGGWLMVVCSLALVILAFVGLGAKSKE